jgi:uncharacterized protein (TIGR03437 family)
VKQGFWFLCAIIVAALIGGSLASVSAQVSSPTPDPFAVQLTSSPVSTFSTLSSDISADGRFVVFTSNGDVATVNKNNADGNREIFLFDYAQRRIYQITNTRNVPIPASSPSPTPTPSPSPSPTASPSPTPTPLPVPADRSQVKIEIDNRNPVISMEPALVGGFRSYVIVFSSNAPHPANFNGVETPALAADANSEIWIYKLPPVADVDLTLGTDIPTPLDFPVGESAFERITDTAASRVPTAGATNVSPFFADDNREPSISDDGRVIAFISTRHIISGTTFNNPDFNPELFIFTRSGPGQSTGGTLRQATDTKDAILGLGFIFQTNPTLSHDGSIVSFMSSANSFNMSAQSPATFSNPDTNAEVWYAELGGTITFHQVTRTQNNITSANLLSPGRRLSRDGKLITFESKATDPKSGAAPATQTFGTFVYTIATDTFSELGARPPAPISDVIRFPTFTDYNSSLAPSSLVFSSFLNFRPNGTFPDSVATANEGLNPDNSPDLFLTQLPVSSTNTFARITNIVGFSGGTRAIASASRKRIAFSIGGIELGGGNTDGSTELFYLLTPTITTQSSAALSFFTGASEMPVAAATPVPSPTPSPTPTPSPVPGQPLGVAPGELTIVRSTVALAPSDADTTGDVSETNRTPALPVELNGVSVSVNGHAAGLYKVLNADKQINFVVPIGTASGVATVAINILDTGANTVTLLRGLLQIVPAQPDIFTFPGNRASALTTQGIAEPFNVTTGGNPTVISLMVTGVRFATVGEVTVTVGTTAITGTAIVSVRPNTNMPGFDIIDFTLPASLAGAGDVPVQVTVTKTNGTFVSRPADTAPRITIN